METALTIPLKPLSVNKAWKGRRYKTDDYLGYEIDVARLVRRAKYTYTVPVSVTYFFHLKNHKMADADNPVKPLQDILKQLGFFEDDTLVYHFQVFKVPSETDYIEVTIKPIDDSFFDNLPA